MVYRFREGYNTFRGVAAQTVGDELERIRKASNGRLATPDVLQWAAEPDSAIHACFTWDDEKAAHSHRLNEARTLIRSVVVVRNETDVPRRAFWNVAVMASTAANQGERQTEHYYQSAEVIATNPLEYQSALALMLRQLASAQTGMEHLRSLAPQRDRIKIDAASQHTKTAKDVLTDLAGSE